MKIVVFTDLHHYAANLQNAVFDTQVKLTQYAMPMLSELVDKVNNNIRPHAVVNLGDSIQDANDHDVDVCALSEVAEQVKALQVPYHMVLGNHDFKMFDSFDEHKEIFGFDSFNYSVDVDGYHLVFMTNGISPEHAVAGSSVERARFVVKETLNWLQDDLQKNTKPCIIFNHFPPIGCEGLAQRHVIGNTDELFAIIDAHKNIRAVISGHTHMAYRRERNGVDYHVLSSPIASLERNGTPDAVYYLLDAVEGTVNVTECKFESF